jgi:hypothetical protein
MVKSQDSRVKTQESMVNGEKAYKSGFTTLTKVAEISQLLIQHL